MAMSSPRSSVFTFESTVHSTHVLLLLDEQRRRDTLCDVTVVAEGQSFRAHRSVLASCSEYFTQRISALTQHGAVISLPQEVTAAGFEPLLKFAYTSKLLFGKGDVLDIKNSASILGFKDLDEACFDFLIPKFLSSSAPFPRKTCCKKKCKRQFSKEDRDVNKDSDDILLEEKEEKPVADSPFQQEAAWVCSTSVISKIGSQTSTSTSTPVAEGTNNHFTQCPKYRKQLACGKESCLQEKSVNNPVTVIRSDRDPRCSPRSNSHTNTKNETEFPENSSSDPSTQSKGVAGDEPWKTEIHDTKMEAGVGSEVADMVKKEPNVSQEGKWSEKEIDMDLEEDISLSDRPCVKASTVPGEMSSGLIVHHCPLKIFGEGPAITESTDQKKGFVMDITEGETTRGSSVPASIHRTAKEDQVEAEQKGAREEMNCDWQEKGKEGQTSSMEKRGEALWVNNSREREVAEHLAKGLMGSELMNFQELDAGSSSDTGSGGGARGTSLQWLHHSNTTTIVCPLFQDLDQSKWKRAGGLSECEGASQSGVSSLNSGEDGDSETEGDSEPYARERAIQMQLPCSVDWIVDLSRNDFQQLLKRQVFTREQLEFVHDMRRRSKNRLAAQRCRKRKLDCIYNLQCEINKLKTEREKLMMEKSQLSQQKLKTCHSVSALCQRVCNEANLQPEQLQVLAKYTGPDCPLSPLFPHMDALLSQPGLPPQLRDSLSACSVGNDKYLPCEEASCSSGRDTSNTGESQHLL